MPSRRRAQVESAVAHIAACANFDGGYGCEPGGESHAGQIFTCVGALAIARELGRCQTDQLGWWLCERQTPGGGLNGRPQKEADVCYSWWVLSSLVMLARDQWIDGGRLREFILTCQDEEDGGEPAAPAPRPISDAAPRGAGISDKPGDEPDVFHTFFGIAGLSLLGTDDVAPVTRPRAPLRARARRAPNARADGRRARAAGPCDGPDTAAQRRPRRRRRRQVRGCGRLGRPRGIVTPE